jgi:glycosyltransferase involved in cell wall biosynthesis
MHFVVFSDDWGAHPSSSQHLFRRIAASHPTLWVNTVGLRPPRWERAEFARAARKVRQWLRTRAPTRDTAVALKLRVVAPPMLPWMRPPMLRAINRTLAQRSVRRGIDALGLDSPILVVTAPNGVDAVGALGERAVVYYCVDDFTRWPGVDGAIAECMERELLDRADLVIATSEHLARTRAGTRAPVHVLPHGVDAEHFGRASDPATRPLEGVRRGRPVLGFIGLVDERVDAKLLVEVARLRRAWEIVLVGPTDGAPVALRREPNIRWLGPMPYERVPEALAAFDVAVLPYAENELTRAINPLKLREYLASGRPIVATPIPEVVRFRPHVAVAHGAHAFVEACESALDGPRDLRASRRVLLAGESWESRAERFLELCSLALEARHERRPLRREFE